MPGEDDISPSQPSSESAGESAGSAWNYFNYFTEIEEYFWRKRGAHLLVSPLDWAIMETWQKAGVPLEAVLRGIDRATESYQRSRRGAGKAMKTLAYCTDAVLESAEEMNEAAAGAPAKTARKAAAPTFPIDELRAYLQRNVARTRAAAEKHSQTHAALASRLADIAASAESAEALLDMPGIPEDLLLKVRREMDRQLALYRRTMKAAQLALVEKQYQQKRLLEEFALPRFSLYYFS